MKFKEDVTPDFSRMGHDELSQQFQMYARAGRPLPPEFYRRLGELSPKKGAVPMDGDTRRLGPPVATPGPVIGQPMA
jgi:hypothetical protein